MSDVITKKVAVFKNVKLDFETVNVGNLNNDDYVQLTEFVEVQFPELPANEVTAKRVQALDEILDQLMQKIQEVQDEKRSLLALTQDN